MLRSCLCSSAFICGLISLLSTARTSIAAAPEFHISFWCGPPAEFQTLERYKEIKEANFTLAFPACIGGTTVEQNRKILDLCKQVGLKAMIMDGRMVHSIEGSEDRRRALDAMMKDYKDHPALFGYHIVDEPGAAAFAGLGEVMAYLKEKDAAHPGYINLMPTYGRDHGVLGTATYEEYVRKYAEIVKPSLISYDHYHFTDQGDRPDFFENLQTVRQVARDHKLPFWNIVLCTQHGWYRNLTEPELRFEAMQTLAFGAHGLLWFTYWLPAGMPESEKWGHSMILSDGSRGPHYEMIKNINADAKGIGDVLVKCESISVFHSGKGATIKITESPIAVSDADVTVGVFRDGDKRHLALVTNRDYKKPAKPQVVVANKFAKVVRFDVASKTWSDASASDGAITLDIPAGDGVLLRW
jgi:hypothetical protein